LKNSAPSRSESLTIVLQWLKNLSATSIRCLPVNGPHPANTISKQWLIFALKRQFLALLRKSSDIKDKDSSLGSSTYDFYKICLQDHTILAVLGKTPGLQIYPFILYIVLHELIHIIRFSKFLQNFDASHEEITAEEIRVHEITRQILSNIQISGLKQVLKFYDNWRIPFDDLRNL